jgi:hypothetical protein
MHQIIRICTWVRAHGYGPMRMGIEIDRLFLKPFFQGEG